MIRITLAAVAALSLAACNSPADETAEQQADALESQAADTSNEAEETRLNEQADTLEQQAGQHDGGAAEAVDGATTSPAETTTY